MRPKRSTWPRSEREDHGLAGCATACVDCQPVDADNVGGLRSGRSDERERSRHRSGGPLDDRAVDGRLDRRVLAVRARGPGSRGPHREYRHGQCGDAATPPRKLHFNSSSSWLGHVSFGGPGGPGFELVQWFPHLAHPVLGLPVRHEQANTTRPPGQASPPALAGASYGCVSRLVSVTAAYPDALSAYRDGSLLWSSSDASDHTTDVVCPPITARVRERASAERPRERLQGPDRYTGDHRPARSRYRPSSVRRPAAAAIELCRNAGAGSPDRAELVLGRGATGRAELMLGPGAPGDDARGCAGTKDAGGRRLRGRERRVAPAQTGQRCPCENLSPSNR